MAAKKFPSSQIEYSYGNMIGKARHLLPSEVPAGIHISTYDDGDGEKYGLILRKNGNYLPCYIGKVNNTIEKEFDVFFIGKDKGRGEYLLDLQKQMESLGLKTKFIITRDGRLSKNKPFYSKEISYEEVIEYDGKSKAILNITMPDQMGATLRDYESIFNEVKLITTNKHIKNSDFYKEENVFILPEHNLQELPAFLLAPFSPVDREVLDRHIYKMPNE